MASQNDNQRYTSKENEETLEFQKEWLSGIQWHVAYVGEGQGQMAVAAYVQANDSDARLATIEKVPDKDDAFRLKMEHGSPQLFEGFGEALDAATERFSWMSEHDRERVPINELTGHEGLYSLGHDVNKEYVVDAFWSEQEPGYVNYNVFSVSDKGKFDILDSGFNNGFLSIEECVEFLADAHYPGEVPNIQFVADCTWEISSREELMEALEDGMLEGGPIPLAELQKESNVLDQVDDLKQEAKKRAAEKNTAQEKPIAINISDYEKLTQLVEQALDGFHEFTSNLEYPEACESPLMAAQDILDSYRNKSLDHER